MSVQGALITSENAVPTRAEDGLPAEVSLEVQRGNLVRAARFTIEKGISRERAHGLQSSAIRQFIEQLHNLEGTEELVSSDDLNRRQGANDSAENPEESEKPYGVDNLVQQKERENGCQYSSPEDSDRSDLSNQSPRQVSPDISGREK